MHLRATPNRFPRIERRTTVVKRITDGASVPDDTDVDAISVDIPRTSVSSLIPLQMMLTVMAPANILLRPTTSPLLARVAQFGRK